MTSFACILTYWSFVLAMRIPACAACPFHDHHASVDHGDIVRHLSYANATAEEDMGHPSSASHRRLSENFLACGTPSPSDDDVEAMAMALMDWEIENNDPMAQRRDLKRIYNIRQWRGNWKMWTDAPTDYPTDSPTFKPSSSPTRKPTPRPTFKPTRKPTSKPISKPNRRPTNAPMTATNVQTGMEKKKKMKPRNGRKPNGGGAGRRRRGGNMNRMRTMMGMDGRNVMNTRGMPSPPVIAKSPTRLATPMPISKPISKPTSRPTDVPTSPPTVFPTFRPTERIGGVRGSRNKYKSISIPVYFHVFLKGGKAQIGYISRPEIENGFMANLRNGFAQSPFQFSLAGVVYVDNSDWFACNNLGAYKVQNRRGGLDAMNVYVCDYAAKGFGGTANLPPLAIGSTAYNDGVTIMNPALGLPDFAHQVLIHQAGHWLGLLHTFEGGCSSRARNPVAGFRSYHFVGDGVEDTPAQAEPTWNFPASSHCWEEDQIDTCADVDGVDEGLDDVRNYMNFLPADCMRGAHFTAGQIKRMVAEYQAFRQD